MKSKEALEQICKHCEYYHQDMCYRAIAGCEEWHKLEKDLEILEIFEKGKKNYVGIPPTYDDKELTITIKKDNWNKIKQWVKGEKDGK